MSPLELLKWARVLSPPLSLRASSTPQTQSPRSPGTGNRSHRKYRSVPHRISPFYLQGDPVSQNFLKPLFHDRRWRSRVTLAGRSPAPIRHHKILDIYISVHFEVRVSQELRNGAPDAAERGVCIQKRPLTQFWHCHKVVVSGSPPPHLPGFSAEPPELGTCECNGLPQNTLPYLAILEIHPSTSPSTRLWDV